MRRACFLSAGLESVFFHMYKFWVQTGGAQSPEGLCREIGRLLLAAGLKETIFQGTIASFFFLNENCNAMLPINMSLLRAALDMLLFSSVLR